MKIDENSNKFDIMIEKIDNKIAELECEENLDILNNKNVSNNFKIEQNNINSDKFIYKEGELIFFETICGFCKYNNNEQDDICIKYPDGKPDEVLKDSMNCKNFKSPSSDLLS